jgi:flagellar export protein FliJ
MAVSRALRRLLRIRNIEEEQCRQTLDLAVADLARLQHALGEAAERSSGGRRLVQASASSGELADRLAGLEETRAADRRTVALIPWIADAAQEVEVLREDYLSKRIERRQAETLIEEAEARDAVEFERRGQQGLDDWYRNRMHRTQREGERLPPAVPGDTAASEQT